MKTAFDLTHVVYEEDDILGFLCAGLSLAPVFAIVANVAVVVARREFIAVAALLGQLCDTVLNVVVKKVRAARGYRRFGLDVALGTAFGRREVVAGEHT
jgi:hypothetical protein